MLNLTTSQVRAMRQRQPLIAIRFEVVPPAFPNLLIPVVLAGAKMPFVELSSKWCAASLRLCFISRD